ncbi:hypothetical protein Tco_0543520 [Tanacetum coccineum]
MQSKRLFLSSLGCLDDVLLLEEESCHFLRAAAMARSWGDLPKEADLLEKAGDFQEAAMCLIWCVLFTAAWGNGNRGWPLNEFKVIIDQRNILAELKIDFHNSKENGSFMGKLLSLRPKSLFELCILTGISGWRMVCENDVNSSTDYVLIDKDADWIRNYGQKGLYTDWKRITIDGKQLAFAVMSYWQSKFLYMGMKVLETLDGGLQYSKSNGSIFHQGASLLYMFDISKFLLDCKYLNVTSTNRRRLKRFLKISLSYFDLVFPLDWQNIVYKDLVPLRKIHLEGRLLEEIILQYVDTKEDLTYWTIKRVIMILLKLVTLLSIICLKVDHAEFLLDLLSGRNNISCFLPKKFVGNLLRKMEDKKLNMNIEVDAEAFLSINDPLVIVSSANVTPKIATICALFVDLRKSKNEIVSILFPRKNKHIVRILSGAIPEEKWVFSMRLARFGLEVGLIRRIQGLDMAYWGFLGVGKMLDIIQNIHILYLQYGVLTFSGYGILGFIPLWSLVSVGTNTPYLP